MKSDDKIMKNIEQLGERYCRECLGNLKKKDLQKNWWEALKFFFSHSFLRGRRDKLSNEYYYFTIKTLEERFQITNENLDSSYEKVKDENQKGYFDKECILTFKRNKNLRRKNSIKHIDFQNEVAEKNPIIKLLITPKEVEVEWGNKTYKKEIFLGNEEDVMMVLDVLRFISSDDKKNIYKYLKDTITSSGVEKAYNELIGIRAIADKIATFIIRDVGLINLGIVNKDYEKAFPVDTWVNKIARRIGCHNESIEGIKSYFINKCKEANINPLKFAAGLWVLGFHSLDILLEHLGEIKIKCNNSPNSG
jgi:hypothetical protein